MASSLPDHVTVMPSSVGEYGEVVGPVDYGCVRRYRHRRLATYLWLHGFRDTLRGLLNETDAFMSVPHLSGLVRQGLWDDAIAYLSRFLRPCSHPQSDEAQVLLHFLKHHKAFASMVAGPAGGGDSRDLWYFNHRYNTRYLKHDGTVSHDDLRMRSIVLSLLLSPQVRASLDWERVRHKAARIVHHLVFKAPELKDLALLPGGSMMSHDVLPVGFRSRRRRYVKEQDLPRPKTLTKIFLSTKKRLPSSTRSHELNRGLTDKTRKWVVDILDESLQAGYLELQSSGKKGAPVAAVSQTVNLTSHAENSGISAVINGGTSKLLSLENSNLRKHPRTEEILFEQDPHPKMQRTRGAFGEACLASVGEDESLQAGNLELQSSGKKGVPGATVLHPMSNILTDLTRNSVSGTSSLANADALVAPVSQIMSGTLTVPTEISGAPVAAVSETVN